MSALVPVPNFPMEAHASIGSTAKWAFENIDPDEYPIWQQLPREPSTWYERFSAYLIMQPHERGVLKICNRMRLADGLPPITMLPHEWKLYSMAWRWRDRASAFDLYNENEEKRELERKKKESKSRRISILSSLDYKIQEGLDAFNPDEDAFRFSELVSAIKTLGQESRAEFDDGPTKRSEVKITTIADMLQEAEREEYGDILEADFRDR